jgi:hypothetical protein
MLAACQTTGGLGASDGTPLRAAGSIRGGRASTASRGAPPDGRPGEYELALRLYPRGRRTRGATVDVLSGIGSANLRLGRLGQAERILRAPSNRTRLSAGVEQPRRRADGNGPLRRGEPCFPDRLRARQRQQRRFGRTCAWLSQNWKIRRILKRNKFRLVVDGRRHLLPRHARSGDRAVEGSTQDAEGGAGLRVCRRRRRLSACAQTERRCPGRGSAAKRQRDRRNQPQRTDADAGSPDEAIAYFRRPRARIPTGSTCGAGSRSHLCVAAARRGARVWAKSSTCRAPPTRTV